MQAYSDWNSAVNDISGRTTAIQITSLDGQTFYPGVYEYNSQTALSLSANATVTLNGRNNPDAVWIFRSVSAWIEIYGSMEVINLPGYPENVNMPIPKWWYVRSTRNASARRVCLPRWQQPVSRQVQAHPVIPS
jgi:hypothetical protein